MAEEEGLFSMELILKCSIFLLNTPNPFFFFKPNSHEFSKANCNTSGLPFFPLDAFSWLLLSSALQRQAEMLSSFCS